VLGSNSLLWICKRHRQWGFYSAPQRCPCYDSLLWACCSSARWTLRAAITRSLSSTVGSPRTTFRSVARCRPTAATSPQAAKTVPCLRSPPLPLRSPLSLVLPPSPVICRRRRREIDPRKVLSSHTVPYGRSLLCIACTGTATTRERCCVRTGCMLCTTSLRCIRGLLGFISILALPSSPSRDAHSLLPPPTLTARKGQTRTKKHPSHSRA